jgi:penicillin-binding protein 2
MARHNSSTFKDHIRESIIFSSRSIIAAVIIALLVILLVARLAWLQIFHQEHYKTLSENNRVNILPIPPTRGLIYDRNGILLAQNIPTFTLELVPEHIPDLKATIDEISKLITISEEDLKRFNKNLKRKRRFEGIPLRFRLNDEEVARLSVKQYRLPGVEIIAALSRQYPLGNMAAHTIGYVGRINEKELRKLNASDYSGTNHIGKIGIERSYEDLLHGQVGFQRVETNAQGRILKVLERTLPVPGKNLFLTLDAGLQAVAEKVFTDSENTGALVAIDPRNGDVLAMASMPTFDPNLFVNGLDSNTYRQLRESPDRPLFNRAITGQYPPGSTIKPLVGLAGLELQETYPRQQVNCPGWYMLENDERRYRDWKKEGHAGTDLTKAIVESCDVYFYDLSLSLGIDRISQYLSYFKLGTRTNIDVRGELAGLLPSRAWKRKRYSMPWFPGETLITGIGQGFMLTTPLQLSNFTAILSKNGKGHQPRLLHHVQDPVTRLITLKEPVATEPVPIANQQNWQTVLTAMKKVVHSLNGTARGISFNLPYKIAGKTGTAQVFSIKQDEEYEEEKIKKKLRDHALFVGFAPAEDPKIAVAVIVENGGSGGAVAAPMVRKVMDRYLLDSLE